MIDYVRHILTGQFEAALAMLNQCRRACPPEHWEGKIANSSFRYIAYHTLFFLDFYLSPNGDAFVLRDVHHRGGDERGEEESIGLSQDDALAYVPICRQKMLAALAAETRESFRDFLIAARNPSSCTSTTSVTFSIMSPQVGAKLAALMLN